MPPRPLTALLLSDGKPGHYNQAEGVIAAIARIRPVETERIELGRRFLLPTRTLHQLLNLGAPAGLVLRAGYGLPTAALPRAGLVVSAGGETLAANVAAAKALGAANVFCGRLRRVRPEHVSVVITSLPELAEAPNHLVVHPPSPFDLEPSRPRRTSAQLGPGNPPKRTGVLIGGNSGTFTFADADWAALMAFLAQAHKACGVRWLVTTSRRSGDDIGNRLKAALGDSACGIDCFVDYRDAGPGTLRGILAEADAILCTDDSTTMISEAIGAGLPTVAVAPRTAFHEPREQAFRDHLARSGWYRAIPLAGLTPGSFLGALQEIVPRTDRPLDELAAALRERLPALFADEAR